MEVIVPGYLRDVPLVRYTSLDVCLVLQRNGLGMYTDYAVRRGVDGEALQKMEGRGASKLRITSTRHRHVLFNIIRALRRPRVKCVVRAMSAPRPGRSISSPSPKIPDEDLFSHAETSIQRARSSSFKSVTPPRSALSRSQSIPSPSRSWVEVVSEVTATPYTPYHRTLAQAVVDTEISFLVNSPHTFSSPLPVAGNPASPYGRRNLHPKRRVCELDLAPRSKSSESWR
eukprot:TRINITY_DN22308_c0_g1_i3.p1 TRINITY_DN22308_c0_g1~~TRINITY_DN22308_c0_g1_i3.p1  ORF type:complete len:229 (+),score=4.65 TRINITY_DN22308_c0_g1_i3:239-925(+)